MDFAIFEIGSPKIQIANLRYLLNHNYEFSYDELNKYSLLYQIRVIIYDENAN